MKTHRNPYGGDQAEDFFAAALDGLQYRVDGIQATLDALRATLATMQNGHNRQQPLSRPDRQLPEPAPTEKPPSKKAASWTPERRAKMAALVRRRWKAGVYNAKVRNARKS